jgi:hypothetical protein
MALHLPPELEHRVVQFAEETHRDPQDVLVDLLDEALGSGEDFLAFAKQRWAESDAAVARGEYFEGSPSEIMDRIRAKAASSA